MEKYIETRRSKWARRKLQELVEKGEIAPESPEGRNIEGIAYDSWSKGYYFSDDKLNLDKMVDGLRIVDEADYTLMKLCIRLNLDEEQLKDSIKAFHRDVWGNPKYLSGVDKSKEAIEGFLERGRERVKRPYKRFCDYFEITPDASFPDW